MKRTFWMRVVIPKITFAIALSAISALHSGQ